jgi:signal transduction histidine kinase
MSVELELELRSLKPGDHACQLFDRAGGADDWETIVPFFMEGLSRGERCHLWLDDAAQRAMAMQKLSAAGVNPELEVQRGALTFTHHEPKGFAPGRFDPRARLGALEAKTSHAFADGFSGFRSCSASPYFPPGTPVDERAWVEFESLLNDVCRHSKAIALCRHDLQNDSPGLLREVLRMHPKAVLGPWVCPCTYYEPPRMVLGESSDEDRLHWMIHQLCEARLAQRALERAVQSRDDFLSAASHEFRTPLAAALLDLESVMRATESGPEEHVPKSALVTRLRRMKADVQRFVEVVQQLVDATRLREEHLEFHLEAMDLRDATKSVLERCAEKLRRSRCQVNLVATEESVVGQWDRMRNEQVIAILVENAAKFGESKPIEVTVSRSDGVARLEVRDHGMGIPPEDVPRIFGRFERGVPVHHYGGFGLGLWMANTIVDAFRGHLAVISEPGNGTTFTVDLPLTGP